jgi:F0F1-type ATP synthase epsilon subunit
MSAQAMPTMQVKIYAPFKVYYDSSASSVSAKNGTGPFDILPHHKNFISLLQPCDVVVRQDGKPDYILPITRGIMHVKADKTTVFLDV